MSLVNSPQTMVDSICFLKKCKILKTVDSGLSTKRMISAEENFQNEFLRPILKEKNELLIAVFKQYLLKHKVVFEKYSPEDQANYIENTIKKDAQLRNYFVGMVIGKLSVEQYEVYVPMETELNRRIITMLVKRLQSQMI